MPRKVDYNSQRDNFTVSGVAGHSQCFSTCAWMLLSYFCPDHYKANDDAALKAYIADLTKRSASDMFEWSCQLNQIQKYLTAAGAPGTAALKIDLNTGIGTCDIATLREILSSGPAIIGTKKMAGLPGGHIILGIDSADNGSIVCNDPYGNALTGYSDRNGESVIYPVSMFDANYPKGPVRVLWY